MKTVLVVDDEFDILEALQSVLEVEGYRVVGAGDGVQGLEQMRNVVPDLALVDLMMPRMSGLELTRAARSDARLAHVPIVMMSAVRPSVRKEEGGWQAFLPKPFDLDALMKVVRQFLGE